MKRSLSQFKNPATFIRFSVIGLVMAGAGFTGIRLLGYSSAATTYTHNPFGAADYCTFEGSNTVLYGWAHDTDAPAGALPSVLITVGNSTVSVPTSVSGYRDAAINKYITATYPGMPTSSVYGWRLQVSGLYKGNSYTVGGTALNYGTGANTSLNINSTTNVGGNLFTASKTLPDACLGAPPAPAPAPSPTPTPTPTPPKGNTKTPPKTTTPVPASTALSDAADATVTVGTSAVSFSIPAGGAASLHVKYGTDPATLDQNTPDLPTNDTDVTAPLTGLTAKTAYTFQVVRTQGTQTTTSASTTFITKGYDLNLIFTTKNKPVSGIKVSLGPSKFSSDKNGKLTFPNLPAGSYSPTFTWQGHSHSQTFNTYTVTPSDKPVAASLQQTINLDKLTATAAVSAATPTPHSVVVPIIVGILCFLLLAAIIWFILRRRRRSAGALIDAPMPPAAPSLPVGSADIIDQQSHHHFSKQNPPVTEPVPENMGKSLREMVLESMRQEAAKRKGQQPPQ